MSIKRQTIQQLIAPLPDDKLVDLLGYELREWSWYQEEIAAGRDKWDGRGNLRRTMLIIMEIYSRGSSPCRIDMFGLDEFLINPE